MKTIVLNICGKILIVKKAYDYLKVRDTDKHWFIFVELQ